jgi:hypothetical protein
MKTKTAETENRDASLSAAYVGVAASGAFLLIGGGLACGARTAASIAVGVVLAVSNLWVLERLVRVYLSSERGRWAVVALVKAAVLFGMVALLVKTGTVNVLPLVVGFGALPLGVTIGGLWPVASPREES